MKNLEMQEISITYREFFPLYNLLGKLNSEDERVKKMAKKNIKILSPYIAAYQSQVDDIALDHATENSDGYISKNKEGGFDMGKDKAKEYNKAIRALDDSIITPTLHLIPVVKWFGGAGPDVLAVLDCILPEDFESKVSEFFKEEKTEVVND